MHQFGAVFSYDPWLNPLKLERTPKLDKGKIMKMWLKVANIHMKSLDKVDLLLSKSNNIEEQLKNIEESARKVAEEIFVTKKPRKQQDK